MNRSSEKKSRAGEGLRFLLKVRGSERRGEKKGGEEKRGPRPVHGKQKKGRRRGGREASSSLIGSKRQEATAPDEKKQEKRVENPSHDRFFIRI